MPQYEYPNLIAKKESKSEKKKKRKETLQIATTQGKFD